MFLCSRLCLFSGPVWRQSPRQHLRCNTVALTHRTHVRRATTVPTDRVRGDRMFPRNDNAPGLRQRDFRMRTFLRQRELLSEGSKLLASDVPSPDVSTSNTPGLTSQRPCRWTPSVLPSLRLFFGLSGFLCCGRSAGFRCVPIQSEPNDANPSFLLRR